MGSGHKRLLFILIGILVIAVAAAVIVRMLPAPGPVPGPSGSRIPTDSGGLELRVFDTGDSDAILLITPEGDTMLVDTGLDETYGHLYNSLKNLGISRIDILVLTHPHKDHIGGAPQLLSDFSVGQVYMPATDYTSGRMDALAEALQKAGLAATPIAKGSQFSLGSLAVDVLSPGKTYENMNDNSAVLQFTYGEKTFLLMGDAEKDAEADLIAAYGGQLRADFLKAGHHGAKDASSEEFLAVVQPSYAVLTGDHAVDPDHIHEKVIERLEAAGAAVYRTDRDGDITVICDGNSISIQTANG
ncbi:MBL fold metallo-hydrolase [Christensenellaceae bacterium NSJ-63]|uniref:MBL fold metallo-hydrolase n=1 Tax=Guopingia tenuis TaxID=2763656 RepID=A0A926HX45_9FIRM|nr:ComEC/Rec2 family competence protein [Guopingia tenuis]MBC8538371.1 MBL fold metallo-hydrolase [Guopingia tenuis]